MNGAMIAAISISKSDGISKKIISEATGISIRFDNFVLFCFRERKIVAISIKGNCLGSEEIILQDLTNDNYVNSCKRLNKSVLRYLNKSQIALDLFYVRHMMPSFALVKLLSNMHGRKSTIFYEIPTYPYFREQINESKNKIKTLIRLMIEFFFWPIIYTLVDYVPIIKCNSGSHIFKKMVEMYNGVSSQINYKKKEIEFGNRFNVIGVGTIYKYHGYKRIIDAIVKCRGQLHNGVKIMFYIVGESEEIENLKEYVKLSDISKNVVFTGAVFGDDLEKYYSLSHLSVGTMCLSLRKADIDTAIKNIEYLAHDIPILTSGRIFNLSENYVYRIIDEKSEIDLDSLYLFSKNYFQCDRKELGAIVSSFSWNNIMNNMLSKAPLMKRG